MKPAMLILVLMLVMSCSDDVTKDNSAFDLGEPLSDAADAASNDAGLDLGTDMPPDLDGECLIPEPSEEGEVKLEYGTIRGSRLDDAWEFLGIPFAAPPEGELRFRPPRDPVCWSGVRPADAYPQACPQIDLRTRAPEGDEDCLHLNVFTPAIDGDRPVMVFIHGGAHVAGSTSQPVLPLPNVRAPLYNGEYLARNDDVVVVTIQYRLGPLGFFAHPDLSAEDPSQSSGNWGMLDQIKALEWVRENIARFGGDPDQVMIFGESAGAVSTCTLMASRMAEGLFDAALMQSGDCYARPLETAENNGVELVEGSTCSDAEDVAACLRNLSREEVLEQLAAPIPIASLGTPRSAGYGPVIDGLALEEAPIDALENGSTRGVPLIVGSNLEEMANLLTVQVQTSDEYESSIRAVLPEMAADAVLAAYPVDEYDTPQEALIDLTTDAAFTCSTARVLGAHESGHPDQSRWRYFFTRRPDTPMNNGRAAHGVELLYVFGTLVDIPLYQPSMTDEAVSDFMRSTWAEYARTGVPADQETWPVWDSAADTYLDLGADPLVDFGLRRDKCGLWDQILGDP